MNKFKIKDMPIPLTVPEKSKKIYLKNYFAATKNTGRLFLFAGDQKIEHLNQDFYGQKISPENATPKHMFEIAKNGPIGAFATQLGLISRFGHDYPDINYVVKLNAKTNIISSAAQEDPISLELNSVEQVVEFQKNSNLNIVGVGYTIYLGSTHEAKMLNQAAQVVYNAHKQGLIAILWIYPRGKHVKNQDSAEIIAGAAGVGACLGADFIKINPPKAQDNISSSKLLRQATLAADRSGVICSGGTKESAISVIENIYNQIHIGGTVGTAIGRNLHQRDLGEAVKLTQAISAIVFDDAKINEAKRWLGT